MASITLTYQSIVLGFNTQVHVVTPGAPFDAMMSKDLDKAFNTKPLRVVYLLHGAWSDGGEWVRQCGLDRYANEYQFMLVMPSVNNSFYNDLEYGPKYFTYVTEELPRFIASTFHVSTKREDTFICGLSMGGFGTMKCALNHPEKYAAAASMSGALDLISLNKNTLNGGHATSKGVPCEGAFLTFEEIEGSCNDINYLLEHADKTKLPKLICHCGTEDFIYHLSTGFRDKCKELGIPLDYYEEAGAHEWYFWDRNLKMILEKFSKM